MEEVIRFLTANPMQFLATVGLDGKPNNRPFQFMLENGGKLYFCTANTKNVYEEMQKTPYIALSATSADFSSIRLSGKVVFSKDLAIKNKMIDASPLVKRIYQTGSNPIFEIFYLTEVKATITDFSGNPPKAYSL